MAVHDSIDYGKCADLCLDPKNPRLGRENTSKNLSQSQILAVMEGWTLDELAVSFIESGFWPNEALIVVEEKHQGGTVLVVVEGNRRLAALKFLYAAIDGMPVPARWKNIAESAANKPNVPDRNRIPYILADSRKDVQAFLGFRHVTGIKEWKPAEKAEFISKLIDEQGKTYDDVRKLIGSKAPAVRQNYISYRILLQMQELDQIALDQVEERFSVLYLSLRSSGVQQYLSVDVTAEPDQTKGPIPADKLDRLAKFSKWLFGDETTPPLISDSRDVDRFGTVLASEVALDYLENASAPVFETAFRLAGGDEAEVIASVKRASFEIETALSRAHHHVDSAELKKEVRRLGRDAVKLLDNFPDVKAELLGS